MKKYLVVVLAAFVLSACEDNGNNADGGRPDGVTAPVQTPAPKDAPSTSDEPQAEEKVEPAEMTLEEAASQYVELVGPSNCALQRTLDAADALGDNFDYEAWSEHVRPLAADLSDTYISFYESLSAAEWPHEVQPLVDRLVAEVAEDASFFRLHADAPDQETILALAEQRTMPGTVASELRAKLKLPSNITADPKLCPE